MKAPTLSKEADKPLPKSGNEYNRGWNDAVKECAQIEQSATKAERKRIDFELRSKEKKHSNRKRYFTDDELYRAVYPEALTQTASTHKPPYGTPSTIREIASSIALLAHSKGVVNEGFVNIDFYIEQLEKEVEKRLEEQRKEIEKMVVGELSRSELQVLVESMARAVGHTYSAVEGVKNSHNAVLLIAHNSQRQSVDLPKAKMITLEDVKNHRLRGTRKAVVADNYALMEMARDVLHRAHHVFAILNGKDK